jgi:DNA-binding response OmpR family regulator
LVFCAAGKSNLAVIQFGVFELNRETGELRKQGIRLKLPGQAFQVLELLVEETRRTHNLGRTAPEVMAGGYVRGLRAQLERNHQPGSRRSRRFSRKFQVH